MTRKPKLINNKRNNSKGNHNSYFLRKRMCNCNVPHNQNFFTALIVTGSKNDNTSIKPDSKPIIGSMYINISFVSCSMRLMTSVFAII